MSNRFQTREDWLAQAVNELRPVFSALNHPLPANIRVACGFPSSNARSAKNRAVGEHWSAKASADQHHEILISPVVDDVFRVLGILVHELAHASTDGDGHKGRFPALVKALSLEGKPTATTEGAKFKAEYLPLLEDLGVYPHAALNAGTNRKTQGTRMLKAACPHCGYTVRLSAKWASVGLPECPVDGAELILS
jgi:hypothetical protein